MPVTVGHGFESARRDRYLGLNFRSTKPNTKIVDQPATTDYIARLVSTGLQKQDTSTMHPACFMVTEQVPYFIVHGDMCTQWRKGGGGGGMFFSLLWCRKHFFFLLWGWATFLYVAADRGNKLKSPPRIAKYLATPLYAHSKVTLLMIISSLNPGPGSLGVTMEAQQSEYKGPPPSSVFSNTYV